MATLKMNSAVSCVDVTSHDSAQSEELRIVVLGSHGVGKSTLISQFLEVQFIEKYRGTFEIVNSREYKDDGYHFNLDIIEISRGDAVPTLRKQSIENSDAFILMYSVDDKNSFEELYHLRDIVLEVKGDQQVPIYIVANKVDVSGERLTPIWQIADAVATIDWEHGYMELSARDKQQVDDLFRSVVRLARTIYTTKFKPRRRMTTPAAIMARIKERLTIKRHTTMA